VFGAAFFIINLLLVIQVLGFGKAVVSERYSYVPYIGLAFLVCMLLDTIQSKSSQLKYGLIPFVVLLMVISFNRIKVWEDSIALFSDVTEKYPTSAIGWNNLGTALYRADKMDDGLDALNEAIKLNPSYAEAYNNRGAFFLKTNNFVSAEPDIIKATTLRNNYSTAFYNLGVLYSKTGKLEKAIDNFKISIAQNNDAQSAYYNMAICYNQLGDKKAALDAVKNAITLKPSDEDAITLQNSIMQLTAAPQIKATTDTNTGDKFSKSMAIQQNAAGKNLMASNNPEKAYKSLVSLSNKRS
jgi:tetratricopeptide (TPR) repeat protein